MKVIGNCIGAGTENAYGINEWYGSVYDADASHNPTTYLGFVTENAIFDRNNAANGVSGATADLCTLPVDNFFVRYKMRRTFPAGQYSITVGGDDGYRFSINGGATWVDELSNYILQSYGSKTAVICLDGSTDMVLEYFENGGNSQVSFNYSQVNLAPATSLTASNTICLGNSTTLTAGGTGTFEWGTGTVGQNIIANESGNSIIVSPNSTTTYWVRKKEVTPCVIYSTGLTSTVTVIAGATAPTSISSTSSNCPGTAVTLTAVGGSGNTYQWGTGAVGTNVIGGATTVSITVNPTNPSTTYWVRRVNTTPCSGNTAAVTLVYNLLPFAGDEVTFGNESWIGYVYNSSFASPNLTVNGYLGYVTEAAIFNRNIVTGNVSGATSVLCSAPNENFFVRYKMKKNFPAGQYSITVGGDDGFRFSIDGGFSWIDGLSSYVPQSYITKNQNICLNGTTDLVIEYYENGGDSQVSFTYTLLSNVAAPTSLTASSSICFGTSKTLTAGGTGTFEWGTGTIGENIIAGSTGTSISVSPTSNTQYWVRRKITTPCLSYSSVLTTTVTVTATATAPTSITGIDSSYCPGAAITLTAIGGSGATYQWGIGTTLGSNIISGTTASISVSPSLTTTYWVRRVNSAPCTGNTGGVFKTVSVYPIPGDDTVFGINEWNVYGYENTTLLNPTNYKGYYVQNLGTNVGFDSKLKWDDTSGSPASSVDWQGCPIVGRNFTFIHKRQGFPCGQYQLAFLYYDEDTVVTVKDAYGTIWTQTYANYYDGGTDLSQAINGTTTSALNADSTIEVRTRNTTGPGKAGLKVTSNGIATYANGTWDKAASYSAIQVNDNLNLTSDLTVCSCSVQSDKNLIIESDKTLVVLENIVVANGGQIIVENNGALVQVEDNATYTGSNTSFKMNRNTTPLFRLDYTYWSTPLNPISGYKLIDLSPNTLATKYYKWSNAWVAVNRNTEVMVPGKGYIIRAPNNFPMESSGDQPQIDNVVFTGQPNNGMITIPIDNSGDGWNLIGNPYPSALDIEEFYRNPNNQSILDGTIYLWTHNTEIALSGTSYNYSKSDYASYNMTGGTGTTGGNVSTPEGKVASGQPFFIKGLASGNAVFNNSMRVRQGGLNNQFFKPAPTEVVENWQTTGKHRVWLNLTSTQNDFNQTLIGYIENATNQLDWGYDGDVFSGGIVSIYSIANNKSLTIQGRALPFSNLDEVPLGYKTTLTGTLTISIDHLDGLLEGQNIYLKDNVLNLVHNLNDSEYSFTTIPGTFNERFVLQYLSQKNRNKNNPLINENSILVFNSLNQISIKSSQHIIKKAEVYDLQGRLLFIKNGINEKEFRTQNLKVNTPIIVVKITTGSNAELLKKVVMN